MKTRHPIEGPFGSEFLAICNHCGGMTAWSRKTWEFCEQFLGFFGKMTPYGKIFKILFRKFSTPHWSTLLCWNVIKIFPIGNRRNRALFTEPKTNKISAHSRTVATAWIVPKVCQGQPPTFGSHCSRFHPKQFTFGRVLAKCVKAVLLPCRVFSS